MARETAYERYTRMGLAGTVLTEAEIMRGLRGVVHKLAQEDARRRHEEPAQYFSKINTLLAVYEARPRAITPEHTAKGLAWFEKMHRYVPAGFGHAAIGWRDTELSRCFHKTARAIVDDFDRFEFVGLENTSHNSWPMYVPAYCVYSRKGESFTYHMRSWQSGGGVHVY